MGLARVLGVAPKVVTQRRQASRQGFIDVARKAHGLILKRTVTGPEGCLQTVAFHECSFHGVLTDPIG